MSHDTFGAGIEASQVSTTGEASYDPGRIFDELEDELTNKSDQFILDSHTNNYDHNEQIFMRGGPIG